VVADFRKQLQEPFDKVYQFRKQDRESLRESNLKVLCSLIKWSRKAISCLSLFAANCSACHYPDRKDKKVGPGLMELFNSPKLPDSGLPVTDENVRKRIVIRRRETKNLSDPAMASFLGSSAGGCFQRTFFGGSQPPGPGNFSG
jgi:hypothetical protein